MSLMCINKELGNKREANVGISSMEDDMGFDSVEDTDSGEEEIIKHTQPQPNDTTLKSNWHLLELRETLGKSTKYT